MTTTAEIQARLLKATNAIPLISQSNAALITIAEEAIRLSRHLESQLQSIRAETLERCAMEADKWASDVQRQHGKGGPAAAIRKLGEEK